jgi:hypothetical protein
MYVVIESCLESSAEQNVYIGDVTIANQSIIVIPQFAWLLRREEVKSLTSLYSVTDVKHSSSTVLYIHTFISSLFYYSFPIPRCVLL